MRLYYSSASPFVRKVLVLAHETGLIDQIEIVDVTQTPLNPSDDLAKDNPLGKIPTMVLADGHSLFDSRVICEYLDGLHAGEKMIPEAGIERMNVLVTQSIGDGIMDAAVAIRYEQALRPEEKQWQDWMDGQFKKIAQSLDTLEHWRGARIPEINLGTIAVAAALSYLDFRHTGFDWRTGRPVLTQMLETFSKRASMIKTDPAG
ncbi:MAG: glutathione S-transferase N-terminal domain-containing protein [Pseudomonadota bacterium]